MPIDLGSIVQPATTALVISECQRDIVGDLARLPQLAAAAVPAVTNAALLAKTARRAGVQVIHASATVRPDGKGANTNTRLSMALRRRAAESGLSERDPGEIANESDPVAEIGLDPRDILIRRIHGMSPMHDTGLDAILRNLAISTVVVTGVSLNVAIPNTVMDAVNRGYRVCVPRDAVAGVPPEYGEQVLEHTIAYLAYLTTTAELVALWS